MRSIVLDFGFIILGEVVLRQCDASQHDRICLPVKMCCFSLITLFLTSESYTYLVCPFALMHQCLIDTPFEPVADSRNFRPQMIDAMSLHLLWICFSNITFS